MLCRVPDHTVLVGGEGVEGEVVDAEHVQYLALEAPHEDGVVFLDQAGLPGRLDTLFGMQGLGGQFSLAVGLGNAPVERFSTFAVGEQGIVASQRIVALALRIQFRSLLVLSSR